MFFLNKRVDANEIITHALFEIIILAYTHCLTQTTLQVLGGLQKQDHWFFN